MYWSLLYTALSTHYFEQEPKGKMSEEQLSARLLLLQVMTLEELALEYTNTLNKVPPAHPEDL